MPKRLERLDGGPLRCVAAMGVSNDRGWGGDGGVPDPISPSVDLTESALLLRACMYLTAVSL